MLSLHHQTMSPERRAEIVGILEQSRIAFQQAVEAVPAERALHRPAAEAWNPLEITEHVAVTEMGMFRMLGAAEPDENAREDRDREAIFTQRIVSREKAVSAPDRVKPTGRFATLGEALAQFDQARQNTLEFARETEQDLFRVSAQHPFFGAINGYELLIVMAGHARRHAAQITQTVGL